MLSRCTIIKKCFPALYKKICKIEVMLKFNSGYQTKASLWPISVGVHAKETSTVASTLDREHRKARRYSPPLCLNKQAKVPSPLC